MIWQEVACVLIVKIQSAKIVAGLIVTMKTLKKLRSAKIMNNDLISRSRLRMDFIQAVEDENPELYGEIILDLIDCAPSVEQQQGEWIAREDMDYIDENKVVHNHFECNKCGLVHDFIDGHTSQYNFCPNCNAKMGGEQNG